MWWRRQQQDFNAELDAHLQLEIDQLVSEGLSPQEAQAAARRAFGNRLAAEERFYESGRWMSCDHLARGVRFAVRVLAKDARFTVLAVLGLALGLGVSTAIFAVINAAAGEGDRAAVQDSASYVGLYAVVNGRAGYELSYPDYRYYQSHATAFRTMNAESGRFGFILGPFSIGKSVTEAQDVKGRFEAADFLSVVGLQPALGRSFSKQEEQIGGPPVAVLNFRFWKLRFGADPGILGKTLVLNGHPLTVIGIANARFAAADQADFYLPLALQPVLLQQGDWLHDPEQRWLMPDARLRPNVTVRQAQAEVDVLSNALRRTRHANSADGGVFVSLGGANPEKQKELIALALTVVIAVSMILLIACSNLANVLLARAVVRRREIGVRLSLGASRARVVSQLLTESMLLAVAGGALGLLFSHWLAKTLFVLLDPAPGFELRLDPRVVLYGIVLSIATGFSFSLAPALAATRTNLAQALHSEGFSGSARSKSQRIWSARNVLVIVPLAVSLMLLMGAGLSVRLIQRMYLSGPAFDTSHLIGMWFPLNLQGYDEARTRQFQENLRDRIGTMPGVTSVALASTMPLTGRIGWFPLLTEGSDITSAESSPHADYNVVSTGFFETVGAHVVRGRTFTTSDREGSPPVALVNQNLARTYWPNEESIGKRIRLTTAGSTFFEVIGVAPDLEDANGPFNTVRPTVYVPFGQGKLFLHGVRTEMPPYQMQFLVRTSGDPARVKAALRQEASVPDASLRIHIQTLEEMLEENLGPLKTTSLLLSALGALALVMASVGIYAVLAYAVSQRTREIGIRLALGAQRQEILTLVMKRSVMLIALGIGLGLIGALALSRALASTLAELGGLDALTCISVAFLLGAVAILASYVPARKALRVDPMQVLRCE
jgi:putative ABC transport system permease protein